MRLLYANAGLSSGVTILAATILAYLQRNVIANGVVAAWWVYMLAVAAGRGLLGLRFRRAAPEATEIARWRTAFAVGAGLSGVGWGGAGLVLYQEGALANQMFLVFVLGGMMLGAASLLAARPEAFLPFLIPAGLGVAVRMLVEDGQTHLAMGALATVFTLGTVITTGRIYRTIDSSLRLQFENRDLVLDLQAAKDQTEALNRELERRVEERTSELRKSTELLRAEMAQRRQMEEDLLRARKLESLGVLAGGIAHDFNNFLTIVQGNVEIARRALDPGHPMQEMLEQAVLTCQRASFLASQLLTFAKGGAPVRRVASMAALVQGAVHLAGAGAPISIAAEIAPDLLSARVDAGQIGQVLHNLLLNARQAMPDGGTVEVKAGNVKGANGEPRVRISVRDHGCGIPQESLPRIFDPYFTTKSGGSGLGLATAYSIVARHDGHIVVESKLGQGTVFTVELPATLEQPTADVNAAWEMQKGSGRILVMDDEEALRKLLKVVLGNLGYEIEAARDGNEAIALYEAAGASGRRFDAVLLDLTVSGGMGGVEAAGILRSLDPDARLIVSSGYSETTAMADYARYGFSAVIPKPWTPAKLSEALRRLLGEPDRG